MKYVVAPIAILMLLAAIITTSMSPHPPGRNKSSTKPERIRSIEFPEEISKVEIGDTMIVREDSEGYRIGYYHGNEKTPLDPSETLVICSGFIGAELYAEDQDPLK